MKYFVDTCVWRDFYEDRKSFSGRDLGKEAATFFQKVIADKNVVLFSESLIDELKIEYSFLEIEQMLKTLSLIGLLKRIDIKKEEFIEAKNLSKSRNLPFVDCLNAVQARNHRAMLISQDKHILRNLADMVVAKRPSEII